MSVFLAAVMAIALPFRMEPLPVVAAFVNGKPARLAIDTGGPGLDLAPSFAAAIGVRTRSGAEATFAGGLHGKIRFGHVDRLDLGSATLRSLPVAVPERMPPGIDGVIGTAVLHRFVATIDYVHRRLILRPREASADVESAAASRGAIIVPMRLVGDHAIVVTARINDAPPALFNVDTGGPGVGVDVSKAELHAAHIVPDASHPMLILGGGGATRMLPFVADVTLGNERLRDIPGVYLPEGDMRAKLPVKLAGALSQELFKRGALTFDFAAMKLIFEIPKRR